MRVYLVDGTYELFRHFFAVPRHVNSSGAEVGAARGVVRSLLGMLAGGATHLAVATDHVIECFRNELWPGYKTGAGVDPALLGQFTLLEDALSALGLVVWPRVEDEADDALAAAATAMRGQAEQILICTPDKDLGQCVSGTAVVQLVRRTGQIIDEDAIYARYGFAPESIPDYLGLVGDSADGFPGIPGWGAKTASAVLGAFAHLEDVPLDASRWPAGVRSSRTLGATLEKQWEDALLFRTLATLRTESAPVASPGELEWRGPSPELNDLAAVLDAPELAARTQELAAR